jgi:hypothetical protein
MKLSGKNAPTLIAIGLLGAVVGGLGWEVVERISARLGVVLGLSIGPIGFDLSVVSLRFLVNPGTFVGLAGAVLLFRVL